MEDLLRRSYASLEKRAKTETSVCKQRLVRAQAQVRKAWTQTLRLLRVMCLLCEGLRHPMSVVWDLQVEQYSDLWGELDIDDADLREYILLEMEEATWTEEESEFLFNPNSPEHVALWFRAWTLYVEWRLALYTVTTNTNKHIAVPSHALHTKAEVFMLDPEAELTEGVRVLARAWVRDRSANAKAIWLCKWRGRWGLSVRVLPSRSLVLQPELLSKVI